jgi:hypothetical protein
VQVGTDGAAASSEGSASPLTSAALFIAPYNNCHNRPTSTPKNIFPYTAHCREPTSKPAQLCVASCRCYSQRHGMHSSPPLSSARYPFLEHIVFRNSLRPIYSSHSLVLDYIAPTQFLRVCPTLEDPRKDVKTVGQEK